MKSISHILKVIYAIFLISFIIIIVNLISCYSGNSESESPHPMDDMSEKEVFEAVYESLRVKSQSNHPKE